MTTSSGKPGHTGIKRIIKATGFSWQGLKAAYKNESAIRQECVLLAIALPLAFFFADSGIELALLVGSVALVLIVELINSAIEAIVDRVGTEYHELSGRAKDIGSAAVLVTLIVAGFTWLAVLFY